MKYCVPNDLELVQRRYNRAMAAVACRVQRLCSHEDRQRARVELRMMRAEERISRRTEHNQSRDRIQPPHCGLVIKATESYTPDMTTYCKFAAPKLLDCSSNAVKTQLVLPVAAGSNEPMAQLLTAERDWHRHRARGGAAYAAAAGDTDGCSQSAAGEAEAAAAAAAAGGPVAVSNVHKPEPEAADGGQSAPSLLVEVLEFLRHMGSAISSSAYQPVIGQDDAAYVCQELADLTAEGLLAASGTL